MIPLLKYESTFIVKNYLFSWEKKYVSNLKNPTRRVEIYKGRNSLIRINSIYCRITCIVHISLQSVFQITTILRNSFVSWKRKTWYWSTPSSIPSIKSKNTQKATLKTSKVYLLLKLSILLKRNGSNLKNSTQRVEIYGGRNSLLCINIYCEIRYISLQSTIYQISIMLHNSFLSWKRKRRTWCWSTPLSIPSIESKNTQKATLKISF